MPAPTTPPFLLIHLRFPQLSTHRPVRVTQHGLPFYKVPSTPEHTPLMGILYFGWLFRKESFTGRIGLSLEDCIPTPALPTYPRDWLLKARCYTQDPGGNYPPVKHIQTTPLPFTRKPQCSKRSGRRVRFITPEGKYSSYRSRKGRRPHRPHRNSRIKNSHLVLSRNAASTRRAGDPSGQRRAYPNTRRGQCGDPGHQPENPTQGISGLA